MKTPNLSIIIINWKSKAFVRDCLASIYANIGSLTHEILVVDNASFDGCETMVRSEFPEVIFIQSEHNLGFAGANNLAFARSSGRNVLFLNPDTEVEGIAIQELVSVLECTPEAGMVGARLLNSDGSLQTTCIAATPAILNQTLSSRLLRKRFPRWKIWGMRALFSGDSTPVAVEAISGACMLARREVIHSVGGFRTDYFMYAEDMDLSRHRPADGMEDLLRARREIVHHAGGSSAARIESNFSNLVLRESVLHFFRLHRGRGYAALYRFTVGLVSTLRLLMLIIASPVLLWRWSYRAARGHAVEVVQHPALVLRHHPPGPPSAAESSDRKRILALPCQLLARRPFDERRMKIPQHGPHHLHAVRDRAQPGACQPPEPRECAARLLLLSCTHAARGAAGHPRALRLQHHAALAADPAHPLLLARGEVRRRLAAAPETSHGATRRLCDLLHRLLAGRRRQRQAAPLPGRRVLPALFPAGKNHHPGAVRCTTWSSP